MKEVTVQVNDTFVAHRDHQQKMKSLEQAIISELEPVELEYVHHFAHGTYTREMRVPAGTVVTGKIHRHSCLNVLLKGKILVVTDEDNYELEAPHVFVSGPGVKKAAYVLEDVVWLNVHPWDGESDLDQIEDQVIIPSYEALEQEAKQMIGDK